MVDVAMHGSSVGQLLSFVFAALAACGNALSNVMQRKASLESPPTLVFGVKFLVSLVQRPTWMLGFGGMVASFVLQAVALDLGQLSAVEPVITLEVPLTLLVASRVFRAPIGRSEWTGIWVMTIGMTVLIASLNPRRGDAQAVSDGLYAVSGGGTVGFIVLLLVLSHRGRATWRTACLGAAAGTSFGLTATLIKEVTVQLQDRGVLGLLGTWQTYGAIATGVSGVVIMQAALHVGPLLAAQPGFTLMDPLVSILWGTLVYGEVTRSGGWIVPAVLGAAAIAYGAVRLARSPLLVEADQHPLRAQQSPAPSAEVSGQRSVSDADPLARVTERGRP